ncbi:MAG TPA: hypothetical protein VM490_14220 [Armatimonadaceae bacterium]|nr:hypothetical protein [Armatimonadaceae bacterium]
MKPALSRREKSIALSSFVAGTLLLPLALGVAAKADLLGDLLKLGGITLVVSRFGGQFNDALNKLTGTRDTATYKTRVVPIYTVSGGGAVGAVQIAGPPAAVNKTTAVAQVETKVIGIRVRALVPVESKDVVKNLKRVQGVGVSGIVDIKL